VKSGVNAQEVHDLLLANQPAGVQHDRCDLCPDPFKKEVAQVAGTDDRTYTEAEHLALMADAVKRETASLSEVKESAETKVSELSARVDVLEAEKASAETKVTEVQMAFDTYKAEVERAREIETAKQDRVARVKAANDALPETYFTDERVQRWAEMTEEAFAAIVDDLTAAATVPVKQTAAFAGGSTPTAPEQVSVGSILAARRGAKN
jgi:hypothetical protein